MAVLLQSELTALQDRLSWIESKHLNRGARPASVAPYPTQQLGTLTGVFTKELSKVVLYTRRSNVSCVMPNATPPHMYVGLPGTKQQPNWSPITIDLDN